MIRYKLINDTLGELAHHPRVGRCSLDACCGMMVIPTRMNRKGGAEEAQGQSMLQAYDSW